ncbi:MAG TPA: HAD family hydrolase [Candidatus Ozemobacteraceae bacterium]
MNHPDRLILFDIDGTLLSADRSGYHAIERSMIDVFGAERGLEGIRLDGNTDLNAIRQVCERDGRPFPSPEAISLFKDRYAAILRREIANRGHLKPGVEVLLRSLADSGRACLGLVTGNIREGAQIKLERFGIDGYFSFGAFGCEHAARADLVGLAMRRAAERAGVTFQPGHVTVVGDTIHDVASCRPWGIRSLAVATGSASRQELEAAGATWALENLTDLKTVLGLLLDT